MIYILVLALVAGLLLYAMILGGTKKTPKRTAKGVSYLDRSAVTLRWQTILAVSESGPAGLKTSVSDADKLFDHVLQQQSFRGSTMAERLKQAQTRLSDRESVWRAHKLRNSLAHDITFDLVPSQAKGALRDFERGLKDLGAL
jgi:hypothetical protein